MEKENTLVTVIVTSVVVIFGMALVMPMINDSSAGSNTGWTPEHVIWAYDSCISEGGAGDMVTSEGVDNYLQFCKKAIACAARTTSATEVSISSYDSLSRLLAKCEA